MLTGGRSLRQLGVTSGECSKKMERTPSLWGISTHSIVCQVAPQGQRLPISLKPLTHLSNETLHRTQICETHKGAGWPPAQHPSPNCTGTHVAQSQGSLVHSWRNHCCTTRHMDLGSVRNEDLSFPSGSAGSWLYVLCNFLTS